MRQKMRAVSFPDELWNAAKDAAEGVGMSTSELVRRGTAREISYAKMRAIKLAVKRAQEAGK